MAKGGHTLVFLQSSPLSQHINTYPTALTTSFGAFAAVGTALASLLSDEATTECGETRHPTRLAASCSKEHFAEHVGDLESGLTRPRGSRGCFSAWPPPVVAGIAAAGRPSMQRPIRRAAELSACWLRVYNLPRRLVLHTAVAVGRS